MTAYSRMSVLFSVCLYITLTPLISGCATSGDLNHQPRTHPTPVDLVDTWAIALHDGVRGSVEIDSGEFLLSLSGLNRSAYGTVKGIFKGYTQNGFPYFEFTNGNLIDSRLNTRSAVPTLSSANGFRIVNPYGSTTKNSDYSSIQFTLNGEIMRTHQGSISRVRYAEGYNKIRLRQRDARSSFIYRIGDMASSDGGSLQHAMDLLNSSTPVETFIKNTLKTNYNCGDIAEITVSKGQVSRLTVTGNHGNTQLKIFSPLGIDKIMYAVSSDKPNKAVVTTVNDQIPTVIVNNSFSSPYIDFWLSPELFGQSTATRSIPIAIYYFYPRMFATARDCRYVRTTGYAKALTLAKFGFALLLERKRRYSQCEENIPSEYISLYGRDLSISSVLEDVFPNASQDSIAYMTRNIGTLMQNGFDPFSQAFANWRETVLREMESYPDMKGQIYRYGDILFDTSVFLGKKC